MTRPRVTLVVALASNGVIGAAGALPWHLPEDLKHFRALTMGHPIVMGRRTWDSIGRALPGRRSIVVSRDPGRRFEGAERAASLDEAILNYTGTAGQYRWKVESLKGGSPYTLCTNVQ